MTKNAIECRLIFRLHVFHVNLHLGKGFYFIVKYLGFQICIFVLSNLGSKFYSSFIT